MVAMQLYLLFVTIHSSLGFIGGLFGDYDKYPMDKGRYTIKEGERQPGDDMMFSDQPMERGQFMKRVGNEYCYPQKGSTDQVKITSYEVKNLDTGDDGGLAFAVSGGVGQSQVCVFLKTKTGKSYHYKIDVYGFRVNNGGFGTGNFGRMGTGSGNGNYGGFGTDSSGRPNTHISGIGGYYGSGGYGGGNNPAYGNNNPSYGNSNPSYANNNPSYGNSNPAYANSNPSYGSSGQFNQGNNNPGRNHY